MANSKLLGISILLVTSALIIWTLLLYLGIFLTDFSLYMMSVAIDFNLVFYLILKILLIIFAVYSGVKLIKNKQNNNRILSFILMSVGTVYFLYGISFADTDYRIYFFFPGLGIWIDVLSTFLWSLVLILIGLGFGGNKFYIVILGVLTIVFLFYSFAFFRTYNLGHGRLSGSGSVRVSNVEWMPYLWKATKAQGGDDCPFSFGSFTVNIVTGAASAIKTEEADFCI